MMMKKILVNNNQLIKDAKGISRYFYSLEVNLAAKHEMAMLFNRPAGVLKRKVREQLYFLRRKPYDILWSPSHPGPYFAPRHIITVHDLIPLHREAGITWQYRSYFKSSMSLLIKNAAHVVCISATVADMLQVIFKIRSHKVCVIKNGYDLILNANTQARSVSPYLNAKYLLFVGTFSTHKNLVRLIEAFCLFKERTKDTSSFLVIAGHFPHTRSLGKFSANFDLLKPKGILFVDEPDDSTLHGLYLNAHGVVMPSLIEGFGLPIAEAFTYDKPVICSDISVFRELFSGIVRSFFNPIKVESIADSIEMLVSSPGHLTSEEWTAYSRTKEWTWRKASESYDELFNAVA